MQNCIGIIHGGQVSADYGPLCNTRPAYMLPFAGRYRIIDIALSNMANNDFSNVVLYGGKHLRSSLDHIGNGKPWELNRRRNGLVLFPPMISDERIDDHEIKTYYTTLRFFEESKEDHLYFVNPMYLNKIDLSDPYDKFCHEDLDVLFFYKKVDDASGQYINQDKLILDKNGAFKNIGINLGTEDSFDLYMHFGFLKKKVFINLVKAAMENCDARTLRQAIINNAKKLKIGVFEITSELIAINGMRSYYEGSMKLLDETLYNHIFYENGVVFTKSKDEPSALYDAHADIANTLVANGCRISGEVENSIIFRGVQIGEGAIVKNAILFQDTVIKAGAVVVNAILDKGCVVEESVSIVGTKQNPYVVGKNSIIR